VERGVAAVVNQIINTRARLIELDRKIKETEELEACLEAIEDERVEGVDQAIEEDVRRMVGKVAQMDTPIAEALDKLEREMVDEGFTVWSAFCGFCAEELGVEALNLLGGVGPFRERAEKLIELAERLEVEQGPEEIEEYRGILLTAWQR
jgi:hypothetical protein